MAMPNGSPLFSPVALPVTVSNYILVDLLSEKLLSILQNVSGKFGSISCDLSPLCQTLSNDLEMSLRITLHCLPSARAWVIPSYGNAMAMSVPLLLNVLCQQDFETYIPDMT